MAQLKGESIETPPETDLFLDFLVFADEAPPGKVSACFPESCINSSRLRLDAYRRLAAITDEKRLDDFEAELRDRFGKLPQSALLMLDCARIRLIAGTCRLESVSVRDDRVFLEQADGSFLKPSGFLPKLNPDDTPEQKVRAVLSLLRTVRKTMQSR